jgi:glycosyltransferase involved in cell wall biosynthesis
MTRHPDIVHVIPTLGRGGAERVAIELAARLPMRGFQTRIVALFESGALWEELRHRDTRYTQILSSHAESRIELVRRLERRLFGEPDRRPDLIHTHLFGADAWVQTASALSRVLRTGAARIPVVSTAHNVDRDDGAVRRALRAWAVRRMDHVVAISTAVRRYVHEDLRVDAKRITMIPNGIETEGIVMRSEEPFSETPRLITVGRLERQKGHDTLFRALAGVPPPWRLSVIGTGSQDRELKELAEELGIASRVYFLGDRSDVGGLLAEADLFLFPSRWEGMGLALIEAMAHGVPVLASDLPATRDYVPQDRLVAPEDPEAWAHAILASLSDETLVGRALREGAAVREAYAVDRMVDRYAKLYRSVIRAS